MLVDTREFAINTFLVCGGDTRRNALFLLVQYVLGRVGQHETRPLRSAIVNAVAVARVVHIFPMHSTAAAANGFKLSAVEHLGKLLELVLLGFLARLVAVFLLVLFIHKLSQAGQISAGFQKTTDIDLCTDEVTNVAFAVHERCYHQQVHEGTSVSSVVDEHFGLFLASSACRG